MSSARNENKRAVPYINVTPLVDVLLVLLIIFMVISPAKPHRFEARIPERPSPNEPTPLLSLVVTVLKSGEGYRLNMQAARTLEDLNAQLHQALDARPADRKAVFVKAPPSLAYGEVVKVINAVREKGVDKIGLVADKKKKAGAAAAPAT